MKIFKNRSIVCLILCLALCLGMCTVAFATEGDGAQISLSLDQTEITAGTDTTITMTVGTNQAIVPILFSGKGESQDTRITISEIQGGNLGLSAYNVDTGKFAYMNPGNCTDTTVLSKFVFSVPGNLPAGEYTLGVNSVSVTDSSWAKLPLETAKTITFTVVAPISEYIVTFEMNGHGTQVEEQKVKEGCKATMPKAPEADGYKFEGWYADEALSNEFDFDKEILENTTVYAKWTAKEPEPPEKEEYEVTFEMNGHGTQVEAQKVKEGCKATMPKAPEADGYKFEGWYADEALSNEFDFDKEILENTTVYAKWTEAPVKEEYKVTFEMNGHGTQVKPQTVKEGGKATMPEAPEADGYKFEGWYADSKLSVKFDFGTEIREDTTVYAKWTKEEAAVLKTGDNSNVFLWITLSFLCIGALAGTAVFAKKRK